MFKADKEAGGDGIEATSASPQNGSQTVDKKLGRTDLKKREQVPPLAHVTSNIIPLSNVLKYYSQESYKNLTIIIDSLSKSRDDVNDSNRKKAFLEVAISLRHDFIKIYTLVKWASNSKDLSKLIDLLNYFRSLDFSFDQLGLGLSELSGFAGAKLPNADIITSLEVLMKKRPQLPSYHFIKSPPVSPEKILDVMNELNITLMTRMALYDNLPSRFVGRYEVKDGRVYIYVPTEFAISLSVANNLIVSNDEENYKSPFYFVDFGFLFGANLRNFSILESRENNVITKLPTLSHQKLEKVVNTVLLNKGLNGLYEVLHKYSISFKIYLLQKQLKVFMHYTKWKDNIQYKYQHGKTLIVIHYWTRHNNLKSFIELGVDKKYNISFRWFRNGSYQLNQEVRNLKRGVDFLDLSVFEKDYSEFVELSLDSILGSFVGKHSEILMERIFQRLNEIISKEEQCCSYYGPLQLSIQMTPSKMSLFTINPLTGSFFFINSSPIENQTANEINNEPLSWKGDVLDDDVIEHVVSRLKQLKLDMFTREIRTRLVTCGWITSDIVKLNDFELSKLYVLLGEDSNIFDSSRKAFGFFRCQNWPSSWFLCNATLDTCLRSYWWVARIRMVKTDFKIQWVERLTFENIYPNTDSSSLNISYKVIGNLAGLCSNKIIDHMLIEELLKKRIQYLKLPSSPKTDEFFSRHGVDNMYHSRGDDRDVMSIYKSMLVLYNKDMLPIENSSNALFLFVCLSKEGGSTQIIVKLFGGLRNIKTNLLQSFKKLDVFINDQQTYFEITNQVYVSGDTDGQSFSENDVLDSIFYKLSKLKNHIKLLSYLYRSGVHVVNNSVKFFEVEIESLKKNLKVDISNLLHLKMQCDPVESNEVKLIINYLNRYINFSPTSEVTIVGMINYLKGIAPVLNSIKEVKKRIMDFDATNSREDIRLSFDAEFHDLNYIRFLFYLYHGNANSGKKLAKDKVVISLTLCKNYFDKENKLMCKLSTKENLSSKNVKFKKLFELIFRVLDELKADENQLLKLKYDVLVDFAVLDMVMLKITDCFITYLN